MHPLSWARSGPGRNTGFSLPDRTALLLLALLGTVPLPPAARAQETLLRAGVDVKRPKKTTHVDAVYPEEARARSVEKVVVVGLTVDRQGRVADAVVLSGHVLLDEAALAAVRQWRYRPARVDGQEVSVRMVETVPFWLGRASRPKGWPAGSFEGSDTWITWPKGENRPRLELLELHSEELPPPSTLRVYRGTVRNRSKKLLRNVLAVAAYRDSLNAPPEAAGKEIGDLEPGEERAFELKPRGHQVDIGFGEIVDGEMKPLPTRRQIKSMARVLPSRPITEGHTEACLVPQTPRDPNARDSSPTLAVDSSAEPDSDYDRPPKPLKVTRPEYSKQAFDAAMEGTVVLEIIISRRGRVDCARVLQSLPGTGFDAEALRIAYEWQFEPAMKDGHPVPTLAHAPVSFRIY